MKRNYTPAKIETRLSLLILLLLAGIGAAIFQKQFSYNPAVLSPTHTAFKTIPSELSAEIADNAWAAYLPAMLPLTPPEAFKSDNLSDKINGKAELYLASGFEQLKSRRFKTVDDPDAWMEIFVYNMGNFPNAFAVFSLQRRDDAAPAGIAQFSYRTPNAFFFIHGPFYIEIIASRTSEALAAQMERFAQNFIKNTRVKTAAMPELELFPQDKLNKNSLTRISVNAFGYDRFDRIFTAIYRYGETRLTAFISRRESPAEAEQLAKGYLAFLSAYGGNMVKPGSRLEGIKVVDILGSFELVFSQGPYLAGVHEAEDKDAAENLALRLNHTLKEAALERR